MPLNGCSSGSCEPEKAATSQMPRAGAQFRAGSSVPLPYGSRGPLSRFNAQLYPPGGIRPHDTTKGRGSRALPAARVPEARPLAKNDYPVGSSLALSDPGRPKTTRPLHLIEDQATYWARTYPVRPTVGDWTPINGAPRQVAPGIQGGRPLPRTWVTYPTAHKLLPMDVFAKRRMRAWGQAVRDLRKSTKMRVYVTSGISGLDAATALRGKPGAPVPFVGAGRQEPARRTTLRGRLAQQDIAPTPILERMAREAEKYGARL